MQITIEHENKDVDVLCECCIVVLFSFFLSLSFFVCCCKILLCVTEHYKFFFALIIKVFLLKKWKQSVDYIHYNPYIIKSKPLYL